MKFFSISFHPSLYLDRHQAYLFVCCYILKLGGRGERELNRTHFPYTMVFFSFVVFFLFGKKKLENE